MLTRVLRTAAHALEHTFVVGETPTDSSTTPVTVAITDANGDPVQSGNATHAGADTGRYTFALAPQAQLVELRVAWSATIAGAAVVETDEAEIVGGRLFTLVEGRASDSSLSDETRYPTAALVTALLETEQEVEDICDRAFFPRYRRDVLDGTGNSELVLEGREIRSIRAVRVAPRVGQTFTALTVAELAALTVTDDNVLVRTDWAAWTEGRDNIVVEYEYGLDAPPSGLVRAAKTRFRDRLNIPRKGVPDRAISFTTPDGATYRLDQPGPWKTGMPDVDAVYARYSLRSGAGGQDGRPVPASRPMDFDPQRGSIFHGKWR